MKIQGFCSELINEMTEKELLAVIENNFPNVKIQGTETWTELATIVKLNMIEVDKKDMERTTKEER